VGVDGEEEIHSEERHDEPEEGEESEPTPPILWRVEFRPHLILVRGPTHQILLILMAGGGGGGLGGLRVRWDVRLETVWPLGNWALGGLAVGDIEGLVEVIPLLSSSRGHIDIWKWVDPVALVHLRHFSI